MSRNTPKAEYFPGDDRLLVQLCDAPVARTKELDVWRSVELTNDNCPVALEFTNVSAVGVMLDGVPKRALVARLIQPVIAEFKLPVKRRTAREAADREVERLRAAIRDALTALGDGPCQRVSEACAGCAADIDEARGMLRTVLDERQPIIEMPPPLPASVTTRLDAIRARRAEQRRPTATG